MKVMELLKTAGFSFKKGLGQNYLLDENYLDTVVATMGLKNTDVVVEVGTGAGTLTRAISRVAGTVHTWEIDRRLEPVLAYQFDGHTNINLNFGDAMQQDNLTPTNTPFKVVANIPYYITTPLITKFMADPNCTEIIVLVQLEMGLRMVAKSGADFGAITVGIAAWGNATMLRRVGRGLFIPQPNVDSAFVRIVKHDKPMLENHDAFGTFLKSIFSMRRKTIMNGLVAAVGISRDIAAHVLDTAGIAHDTRPEQITATQFVQMFNALT